MVDGVSGLDDQNFGYQATFSVIFQIILDTYPDSWALPRHFIPAQK